MNPKKGQTSGMETFFTLRRKSGLIGYKNRLVTDIIYTKK
jgi:hypothetical protein